MSTARAASMAITSTEAATRLQLMWLASPALPVGGFSYAEGLEAAVEAGSVSTETQAADWLSAQLQLTLARSELPALLDAHAAWLRHDTAAVGRINDWLRLTRESAEFRAQAEQMGRSLLEWLRNSPQAGDARIAELAALARDGAAPLWPVAFALATVLAGADAEASALAFGWGWAENMAQAAMKAVPLGQSAAQRMLSRLAAELPGAIEQAQARSAAGTSVAGADEGADEGAARQAHAPMLAILSARHETQYSRLFRS